MASMVINGYSHRIQRLTVEAARNPFEDNYLEPIYEDAETESSSSLAQVEQTSTAPLTPMESNANNYYIESQYRYHVKKLTAALSKKDEHIERLQARVQTIESKLESMQEAETVHSLMAERDSLEDRLIHVQKAYDEEREDWCKEKKQFQDTIDHYRRMWASQNLRIEELENCQRCERYRKEIDTLIEQKDKATKQITDGNKEMHERDIKLSMLKEENSKMKELLNKQLEEEKKKNLLATQMVDEMEIEAEQKVSELTHDLNDAMDELERKHSDMGAIKQHNIELENTIDNLEHKLMASSNNIERLQTVIENLKEEMEKQSCIVRFDNKQKDESKQRESALQHQLEIARRDAISTKKQLDDCEKRLRQLDEPATKVALAGLSHKILALESLLKERDLTIGEQERRISKLRITLEREIKAQWKIQRAELKQKEKENGRRGLQFSRPIAQSHQELKNVDSLEDAEVRQILTHYLSASDKQMSPQIRAVSSLLRLNPYEEKLAERKLAVS